VTSAARSDTYQAAIDLFQGQQAAAALPYQQGADILSDIASFARLRAPLSLAARTGTAPFFSGA
jgi:hypothetical protein